MKFLALIIVLLLEQLRPLPVEQFVLGPLRRLAAGVAKRLNGGQEGQGQFAWGLLVGGSMLLCALISYWLPWILSIIFAILVLYLSLGFRYEGRFYTDIHLALRAQDLEHARELLTQWRGGQYASTEADEVARLTIEQALVSAHRAVFAVVFWFAILGPAGAVMYRLARFLLDEWGSRDDEHFERFGRFSRQAFLVIDWLPSRVTAILYAIAGNFEDAVFCWRTQAILWSDRARAILVASGAGALGIKLGEAASEPGADTGAAAQGEVGATGTAEADDAPDLLQAGPDHEAGESPKDGETETGPVENPEIGVGQRAGVDNMQAAVGLVWRALVVCLVVLALTTIAVWVGA
jgi:adenosylcobinamide-phosphate synthase